MRAWSCCISVCAIAVLVACSPRCDWREVRGDDIPFTVLLPARPASFSRRIDLNGTPVTMTAAEVDGATFAVGAAELADAMQTPRALESIRTALINNIGGNPQAAGIPGRTPIADHTLDITATGAAHGQPLRLMARLVARDKRIYQILIIGNDAAMTPENAETFFTSFKMD
jgi:hypothetical protein